MKKLGVLIQKEWRDQRVLMLGALVVCIVAIAIAKLLHGTHFDPLARTRFVLPGCLALFTLVLATEAITREAQNGVESTLLRLPVPRATAWLAKVGFITFSVVGFLVLLVLVELTLRILEHRSAVDGLVAMIQPTWWLLIAALGAACVASGCILKRSLPAAFLGIVLVSVVPLLALALPDGRAREWFDVLLCSWTPAALSAIAFGAFLLGSFIAYRVRHPDDFGLRRAAGLAAGVGIVLAPIFAVTAHAQGWAFDITPFSRTAYIEGVWPSPDGRFLAVEAAQNWGWREEWIGIAGRGENPGQRLREEVWILDRSTGEWNQIDDRFRWVPDVQAWDPHGKLLTMSSAGAFGVGDHVFEHIDPISGTVVSRSTNEQPAWRVSWYRRAEAREDVVLTWTARHAQIRLPKGTLIRGSSEPGVVFHDEIGFLVRHEIDPDNTTRLVALGVPPIELREPVHVVLPSLDGRLLYLQSAPDDRRVVDACDGHLVRRFDMLSGWRGWSDIPGRLCIVWHADECFSALNEDGSETPLPGFESGFREFGPDRLLSYNPQRIECMKLDGSEREVLYEARP